MPGGFDLKNKTLEQLKEEADNHYGKQTTDFDKFWYALNMGAFYRSVKETKAKSKEPDPDDLDRKYDDPEEERKALDAYKAANTEIYFTSEEKSRSNVPGDLQTENKTGNLNEYMMDRLNEDVFNPATLDDMMKCYEMFGMMMAKIALEEAKEYEEKLKLFPENDPHRKEKAEYLQMKDTNSKVMSLDNSLKNYINDFTFKNNVITDAMLAESPIPNLEATKKLTMKEFFEKTLTPPDVQRKYFEDRKKRGAGIDENSSVYDAFLYDFNYSEDRIKEKHPEYQKKEATNFDLMTNIKRDYHHRLMTYHQRMGNEIVRNTLKPEEREKLDYGLKMYSWNEYEPPEGIRDWVEKEGNNLIYQKRVDQLNENYVYFGNELKTGKAYGVMENGALSGPFKKPDKNASPYDRFYHTHLGPKAFFEDEAAQKKHLSLVMAARAAEASGVPFDLKKITKFAEGIYKSHAFNHLTGQEVREGLFNKGNALKTQQKILVETYQVPRTNQADYIRKMKELSRTMVPAKGQSEKYQALHHAVSEIASLDPNDPRIGNKLMIANEKMLNSVVAYQKGKKSLRSAFTDGQKRFDNSMDALSIMNAHVPGFRPYAKELVDKTNRVRKVHAGDKHFVDLSDYGTARAKAAAPKGVAANDRLNDLDRPQVGM